MKIVSLLAENYKRIVAVEITPTGNVVELTGKNGNGKSSILDAIWVALGGLEAAPRMPIRKGADEARIRIDLGDIVVVRTFSAKDGGFTSRLVVESKDGARFPSPQAMLDKLLGQLSFDPLAFEKMDARAQFNTLRQFVPGVDFEAIDLANRNDYDRRTALNRRAKQARDAAKLTQFHEATAAAELVDEQALVAELESAGKHNTEIETRKINRERYAAEAKSLRGTIVSNNASIERAQRQIAELQAAIDGMRAVNNELDKKATGIEERLAAAGKLPDPIDTSAVSQKIAEARRHNAEIAEQRRRKAEHEKLVEDARQAEQQAEELTLAMDKREVQKREAIAAAKLPVEGIGFGDNEVLLNGIPFSQASDAERLCCSIALAMAMNPKLRIVRVRDGSLLDDDSMKLLARMANERDYQVWIERVDGSGRVGVVIEDGRVKSQPEKGESSK